MKPNLIVGIAALGSWYLATIMFSQVPVPSQSAPAEREVIDDVALPDFAEIVDVKEKKQQFFAFLYPFIEQQNRLMDEKRQRLIALKNQVRLDDADVRWLAQLATKYRVKWKADETSQETSQLPSSLFDELLQRVDQIPPSLVMAQAANESAWGTSRFAREGNNLFGQWCFKSGCGIIPASRPEGKTYEVKRFGSVAGSVAGYFHNINSQPSYHQLRELRRGFRRVGRGHEAGEWLAEGLLAYSSRGEAYVEEIQAMIRSNGLSRYDQGLLGSPSLASEVRGTDAG
ncbi:glucosaminidase domain-containing protein [Aestuariirhabdus sp. Z084]|uniref:glucosaminidase domain-containing protein n=1 Tax=Aestuariirhabdus haliotis TaxID=2918751 RepID=UPI00201B417F|nr:glucosaminidase domain-containing protein [Aestuariirhabdus haliotis]MCL6415753.1 glucosaminidase domain-containing protein [Aestuariirhabdus haliotis]MCL6419670.1 glucosaminidase domain-containing protein [Aestuariirhabdus haliotis]